MRAQHADVAGKTVFTVEDALAAANGDSANLPRLLSGLTWQALAAAPGAWQVPDCAFVGAAWRASTRHTSRAGQPPDRALCHRLLVRPALSRLHRADAPHGHSCQPGAAAGRGDPKSGLPLSFRERCA